MNKSVVNQNQPSLTEWFAEIGEIEESNAFRDEDNTKNDRLETLYQTIGLQYERPEAFDPHDLLNKSPEFQQILDERGEELCAIRLVPKKPGLPKLRNRGLSIKECYETWFLKQEFNPDDYIAYLCPHTGELLWSTIFIVGPDKIFGEIIEGLHNQLTQGDTEGQAIQFQYDYKDWQWSEENLEAKKIMEGTEISLKVDDSAKREELHQKLNSEFVNDYLAGYFETTVWPDGVIRFIDYNRVLPKYIPSPPDVILSKPAQSSSEGSKRGESEIKGAIAYPGFAKGKVVIVSEDDILNADFDDGNILVCDNTDVRYLPMMKLAGAIITNRGGILSHAAIVSRELKTPCIIGTKNASELLKTGDMVEVDATKGVVRKI